MRASVCTCSSILTCRPSPSGAIAYLAAPLLQSCPHRRGSRLTCRYVASMDCVPEAAPLARARKKTSPSGACPIWPLPGTWAKPPRSLSPTPRYVLSPSYLCIIHHGPEASLSSLQPYPLRAFDAPVPLGAEPRPRWLGFCSENRSCQTSPGRRWITPRAPLTRPPAARLFAAAMADGCIHAFPNGMVDGGACCTVSTATLASRICLASGPPWLYGERQSLVG